MKTKQPPKPRNVPARNLARPENRPRVIPDKRRAALAPKPERD